MLCLKSWQEKKNKYTHIGNPDTYIHGKYIPKK